MTMKIALTAVAVATASTVVLAGSAEARSRYPVQRPYDAQGYYAPREKPPIPYSYSFYPEDVVGGVKGNLPFNNQIRKFVDPLNANGGGGA